MKKILIVEDEKVLRDAYIKILSMEQFEVYGAENGEVALRCLPQVRPDLVLLDILMPKMDGLEFLERANIKKLYPKTKVIAFSNLSSQTKLNKIMKLGADSHLLKAGLSPKELVATIRELL